MIGESLNQLAKADGALATRSPDLAQSVAFRNQMTHGDATYRHKSLGPDLVVGSLTIRIGSRLNWGDGSQLRLSLGSGLAARVVP